MHCTRRQHAVQCAHDSHMPRHAASCSTRTVSSHRSSSGSAVSCASRVPSSRPVAAAAAASAPPSTAAAPELRARGSTTHLRKDSRASIVAASIALSSPAPAPAPSAKAPLEAAAGAMVAVVPGVPDSGRAPRAIAGPFAACAAGPGDGGGEAAAASLAADRFVSCCIASATVLLRLRAVLARGVLTATGAASLTAAVVQPAAEREAAGLPPRADDEKRLALELPLPLLPWCWLMRAAYLSLSSAL